MYSSKLKTLYEIFHSLINLFSGASMSLCVHPTFFPSPNTEKTKLTFSADSSYARDSFPTSLFSPFSLQNPQNKDNTTLSVSGSVISFMPPPSGGADESAGRCTCDSGHCSPEPDDGCCPYCLNQDPSLSSSPSSSLFSSSSSSSGLDLVSERDWEKLRRCLAAAGKGFAIGAGLKGGLSAFWLLSLLRSRRFSNALR